MQVKVRSPLFTFIMTHKIVIVDSNGYLYTYNLPILQTMRAGSLKTILYIKKQDKTPQLMSTSDW